jgi:hypothetical protein
MYLLEGFTMGLKDRNQLLIGGYPHWKTTLHANYDDEYTDRKGKVYQDPA